MPDQQTVCETCGQPLFTPMAQLKCAGCGRPIGTDGGRMVKVKGVCTPFHFGCVAQDRPEGRLL